MSCVLALLQKSREVNRDLQVQLDQVLQQAQDPNSKGNSLFAEVGTLSRVSVLWKLNRWNEQHASLSVGGQTR